MMSSLGGKIYFFGGNSSALASPGRNTWQFDPLTGSWSARADMPTTRSAGGAAALGEHIYVAGGTRTTINRYTPATDSWLVIAGNEVSSRDHASVAAYHGEIWVLGGRPGGDAIAEVSIYNPNTGLFRAGPRMRDARSGFAVAEVAGVLIAVGGESLSPPEVIRSAEAYVPDLGWQRVGRLPVAVHGAGGAAYKGKFYLLTGSIFAGGIANPGRVQLLDPALP